MAPEQLEGKDADARTDLWALGAILYEMVTGRRAFEGERSVSLIGNILHTEPAGVATLQPLTPPALEGLVKRCLAKHPDDRWDTAHDVTTELRWIAQNSGPVTASGVGPATTTATGRWSRRGAWGLAASALLLGVAAGSALLWPLRPKPPRTAPIPLARLTLDVRPAEELNAEGFVKLGLPTPGGSRTALTWTPDGQTLVFVGRRAGVQQLFVRRLDAPDARPLANTEGAHMPAVSADGQWVAFWANGTIRKVSLGGGPVVYVTTGHLVFLRRGVLFAVPFDAERLEVRGAPVAMLDTVAQALISTQANDITGAGQFAVATTGTLAWVSSPVVPYPDATLVTVDRRGQVVRPAPARSYAQPLRVSPDDRRLAVIINSLTERGLWVYDLDRGTLLPLNRDDEVGWMALAPDGRRLVFGRLASGRSSLAAQPADGTGPAQGLLSDGVSPSSITPDGRQVIAVRLGAGGSWDIVRVSLETAAPRVEPVIETPANDAWPALSPDGRWLAHASNVSGRDEVYVRPYPGPGAAEQVSLDGGVSPAWHPAGRELVFVAPVPSTSQRRMMAVDFAPGSPPRIGRPRLLFAYDGRDLPLGCMPLRCYDVAPNGQHFYGTRRQTPPLPPPVTHINIIQNWDEELKAKAPAAR